MANTVYDVIKDLKVKVKEHRLQNLERIEAPRIIIERERQQVEDWGNGKMKVAGMARKYKIADELVAQAEYAKAKGQYYRDGKKDTIVLKITLENGLVFYFDWYGCKLEKNLEYLGILDTDKLVFKGGEEFFNGALC